jgi:hypothetical protein
MSFNIYSVRYGTYIRKCARVVDRRGRSLVAGCLDRIWHGRRRDKESRIVINEPIRNGAMSYRAAESWTWRPSPFGGYLLLRGVWIAE